MDDGQDILGSKLPADNAYGQNGYSGASSDLPGQRTQISKKFAPPDASAKIVGDRGVAGWQTRDVSTLGKGAKPKTTYGHRDVNASPAKVPGKLSRK